MDATNRQRESLHLGSTLGAPADARQFASTTLQAWGVGDRFPDVELVTSELVTNAVRHAGSDVELSLELTADDCVVIAVRDLSERLPVLRPLESARDGGWGLHIVQRVAKRWGLEQRSGEKTIWCEVGPLS